MVQRGRGVALNQHQTDHSLILTIGQPCAPLEMVQYGVVTYMTCTPKYEYYLPDRHVTTVEHFLKK